MSLAALLNKSWTYSKCKMRGHIIRTTDQKRLFSIPENKLNVYCDRCKSPLRIEKKNHKYVIYERYSLKD